MGAEAEAFLRGELVDHYVSTGRVVPPWAWLVPLCHAGSDELARLAAAEWDEGWAPWPQAVGFLAREMLRAAEAGLDITQFQEEVIVPYEAHLRSLRLGLARPAQVVLRLQHELEDRRGRRPA